jgi:hypothetical protein
MQSQAVRKSHIIPCISLGTRTWKAIDFCYTAMDNSATSVPRVTWLIAGSWENNRYYEEWRLLGYKNPVRTSQETHYVSATEYSRLMLCKIWGFDGGDYEECHLLGYKNPVRTSQETHYVSATEYSRLMLCKIWGFDGGDYEECHLLGYKNPVHTSQETHYVSNTESSRLMLCNLWGFDGAHYELCRLLGCDAVWIL